MIRWLPLLALAGCAVPLADSGPTGMTEVTWTLAWDTSSVDRTRDGWCTTTDLGTRVCLTEGRLVTAMTSMVACSDSTARALPRRTWADLLVPTAHAGHPGEADPSAWTEGQVEDLVDPPEVSVATVELFGDTYCQAHWAVDAAWEGTANLEDEELLGTSLELAGAWQRADGRWIAFALQTDLAWGELQDVPELELVDGATEVRVVRDLGALFDGVDFHAGLTDRDLLRNLANNTRFEAW